MHNFTFGGSRSQSSTPAASCKSIMRFNPLRLAAVGAAVSLLSGCMLWPFGGGPDWQQMDGTVALSDNATLKNGVLHLEISDTDQNGSPLAVTQQPVNGQWPAHFELQYDANGLDRSHHYVLEGTLNINGKLRYMEKAPLPVLSHGAASNNVQLMLVPRH